MCSARTWKADAPCRARKRNDLRLSSIARQGFFDPISDRLNPEGTQGTDQNQPDADNHVEGDRLVQQQKGEDRGDRKSTR